jgi:single-strand DNA-binding protein
MNSVNIVGHLTKDPEYVVKENNLQICNFRIAVDSYRGKDKDPRADYISVAVFGPRAESCGKYLAKGRLCAVSGQLRTEHYTDANGVNHYPVKVVADEVKFLDRPKDAEARPAQAPQAAATPQAPAAEAPAAQATAPETPAYAQAPASSSLYEPQQAAF